MGKGLFVLRDPLRRGKEKITSPVLPLGQQSFFFSRCFLFLVIAAYLVVGAYDYCVLMRLGYSIRTCMLD